MPFTLPKGVRITYLGHSAFIVETPNGKRILLDPWIQNNPATPSDKKDVGQIDLMLITHGHFDHIEDAIPIAQQTKCKVVAIYEIAAYLMRRGVAAASEDGKTEFVYPMNKGGTLRLDDLHLSVTMVHADHSCGIKDGDEIIYGGEAVGYIVAIDGKDGGFTFYHAGDTAVFMDMGMITELYEPQLAMLPIGDRFVMSPREAALATTQMASVRAIIPMHYGTFPALTGTPEAFAAEMKKRGVEKELLTLKPGESLPE